jgi:hypothetical protein
MKHIRKFEQYSELDDTEDSTSIIDNILKDLEYQMGDYKTPSSYMDDEYYVRCKAKAEAFEEAIAIVKRHQSKNQSGL